MLGMLFVIVALIVLFTGIGSIMLLGTKLREDQDRRMIDSADPATIKRLTTSLEALQGQVEDLSERVDFTERLLEAPKKDGPDRL